MRRITVYRIKRTVSKLFNEIKSFAKNDFNLFLRLSLLLVLFLSLGIISVIYFIDQTSSPNRIVYKKIQEETSILISDDKLISNTKLPAPVNHEIRVAELTKIEQEQIKAEQERLRKEREVKTAKLAGYLKKVGSPMANYADVIVEEAALCGADYRIITAIAGNESGYGRVPYKLYNPFGYLNKVQYSGWEESLSDLVCKVAKYTNKYTDLYILGKAYGAHNAEQWAKNISWHLSQIP